MTSVDAVWVGAAAALVMSMQVGFCMLESGLVRSKNTINVAFKNLMDFCVAGLLFWAFSYGLMFGQSAGGLIGTTGFLFRAEGSLESGMLFLFQMMFCATAATIVSGAVAERMSFRGYLVVTALVSGILFPVAGGWAWNADGWLRKLGFVDFAGATVVHSTGGWVALAAVAVIGPRLGRFDSKVALASPHSLVTSTLGVLVLFVGWLGFNGGSTLGVSPEIPKILINTVLAGSAGCLAAMGVAWVRCRLPVLPETLNGCVAGLVSVTACCHAVGAREAVIIGAVGGAVSVAASVWLLRMRIDDVVGASAAHAFPGVWGTLSVALFGDPKVLATGLNSLDQLGVQVLGSLVFAVWAFGGGWVLLSGLNRVLPLRAAAEGERAGLNVAEHGASTEMIDLLEEMSRHSGQGDFTSRIDFQPYTEVGQIATEYNKVIGKVVDEMDLRETIAKRLAAERHALEASRKSILGSIEYARRIQEAILPSSKTLDGLFPSYAVLYLPRDIVSGDFYWAAADETSRYLAVLDCTGHGVPGAFMSMIGFVLLQQIVVEQGTREPSEILSLLHQRVRLALGQNSPGSDNRDGMEAGVVRVDADRIVFAGAGVPLLWTEGEGPSSSLGEIRADRHGLGGGRHEPPSLEFTQHTLPRTEGVCLCLATDGIIHQPDHTRRPLDKKGFRQMLVRANSGPVGARGPALAVELDAFRGGAAQRDDITVFLLDVSPGL